MLFMETNCESQLKRNRMLKNEIRKGQKKKTKGIQSKEEFGRYNLKTNKLFNIVIKPNLAGQR